jgi:hypothetical protein
MSILSCSSQTLVLNDSMWSLYVLQPLRIMGLQPAELPTPPVYVFSKSAFTDVLTIADHPIACGSFRTTRSAHASTSLPDPIEPSNQSLAGKLFLDLCQSSGCCVKALSLRGPAPPASSSELNRLICGRDGNRCRCA